MKHKYLIALLYTLAFIIGCETEVLTVESPVTEPIESKVKSADKSHETNVPEPSCMDKCSEPACEGYFFIDCISDVDGCLKNAAAKLVVGKCGVWCVSDSDCGQDEDCQEYKCGKSAPPISDEQGDEEDPTLMEEDEALEDEWKETEDRMGGIVGALEDLAEKMEESTRILQKLNDCTEICAGEYYDIPAVRNEFYSICYQLYYYAGEDQLDDYIEECKTS